MKFFILLAIVVAALADDLTSEEHKYKGYRRGGYGHGHGGYYRRGRRDVEDGAAVIVETPALATVDQSLEEHRNRGYGDVYGGYRGGYGQYPSRYGGYGGYSTGHYGSYRGRRDVALVADAHDLVADAPEVLQVSADLTADEHYRRRYGYSSYGYGYPRYGYSGYGNRRYGYRRW